MVRTKERNEFILNKGHDVPDDDLLHAFLLRYYEEMPYEQIAEIVDSSVGSLKVLYHTAYTRIKERLQKQF